MSEQWIARSDKDTHYTTALAQNALDLESFAVMPSASVQITRVTLWSDQNLDWDLMFFNDAVSQPSADADLHSMNDWIRFTVTDGVQIAATGLFLYSVSGLRLNYKPVDRIFHVGLINRNAAAKNAGATGEVVVELQGITI